MTAAEPENAEQPLREKLRQTRIQGSQQSTDHIMNGKPALGKKRSFEETEEQQQTSTATNKQHTRKRSRDSTAEGDDHSSEKRASHELARDPDTSTNGSVARAATPELEAHATNNESALASPKSKRSRLQRRDTLDLDKESAEVDTSSEPANVAAASAPTERSVDPEPAEVNTSSESDNLPAASASDPAEQSAPIPAAQHASKDPPQTSASAFASSGFSSLAGSSTSGFGAIGKSTGGFGSGGSFASSAPRTGPSAAPKNSETGPSSFGGTLGAKSAFSTTGTTTNGFGFSSGSGFGKLGGGFGIAGGFGSLNTGAKLTSFASGKPSAFASPKPAKTFGTPADDEDDAQDDEEPDESGIKSPLSVGTDEEKRDDRFYEQEAETGEEDELVVYSSRAKLYLFTTSEGGKKEWKERGIGVLKLNQKKSGTSQEDGTGTPATDGLQARFLMRADGSHRVVLNTPIKKGIKVDKPAGGNIIFAGTIDGQPKLETLQLKMKPANAMELYERVQSVQGESGFEV